MPTPLSPLSENQVNTRTPATAVRSQKMEAAQQSSPFRGETQTPTKQIDDDVIDWDDEGGSSPFVSEMPETGAASNKFKQADAEIDAIFEDASETASEKEKEKEASTLSSFSSVGEKDVASPPVSPPTEQPAMDFALVQDDKENRPKTPEAAVATPEPPKKTTSPIKARSTIKKRRSSTYEEDAAAMPPPSTRKTLRFHSPVKSSPMKQLASAAQTPLQQASQTPLQSASQTPLQSASQTPLPKSRNNSFDRAEDNMDDSVMTAAGVDETGIDDTCFSTFSAVPDMTMFARLGESRRNSPSKQSVVQQTPRPSMDQITPRPSRRRTSPSRSPSPTPRRPRTPGTAQTNSTFLIDFTQQIEHFADASSRPSHLNQTPSRRSPQKSSTESDLLSYLNKQRSPQKSARMSTPAKATSLMNLLDFELPPAPTPRSIPTITVRELESMKSQYQSQISSLKATLSGREAEVDSLKKAVGDAERRVGEALENLREEKGQREQIEHEKNEWEKRGHDFEALVKNVREEVLRSEEEKEAFIRQSEESDRLAEKQQRRADEADAKVLDLEAQLATARAAIPKGDGSTATIDEAQIHNLVQQQLDAKVEAVSRELHAVYKKKHETKVATLKKSYEARGEKKLAELQTRLEDLVKQNEELASAAATNSGVESSMLFSAEDRKQIDEAKSTIEEQRAQLAGLTKEMNVMRNEQQDLVRELEQERVEKGELVAAVDEMLNLQAGDGPASSSASASASVVEDLRRSISRPAATALAGIPSSLRQAPQPAVESRIGRGTGMPRPSGISKSRMMSNIERMGGTGRP